MPNPYLDTYREMLAHQTEHSAWPWSPMTGLFPGSPAQPVQYCHGCLEENRLGTVDYAHQPMQTRYSWGIPNDAALDTIAEHSPNGVVEIGAGGGYWAKLLRERGVDVAAFDADPPPGNTYWCSTSWSDVVTGDHTNVARFPDRTLLLVWPCNGLDWTHEVIELYQGDTVIFVGERAFSGSDRMHQLLGWDTECWHDEDDTCDCEPPADALFTRGKEVDIPQWSGLRDYLIVFDRREVVRLP